MTVTGHDDIQDLLGAYALDAVEPGEAEIVARHLEVCPRCRAEIREHREVAGLLGYAGQEAPAGLWDRISASTQEPPPALQLHRVTVGVGPADRAPAGVDEVRRAALRRRRTRGARSTLALLSVAAAVAVAVLSVQVARLDHRTTTIGHEVAVGAPSMDAVKLALAVPGARKVALVPLSTGESVQAVILPSGQGYLYDARLTALPSDQTYQLWGLTGTQTVSYGILGATPASVVGFHASGGVKALAVTTEVAGGVEHSTHAPVASGGVPATL